MAKLWQGGKKERAQDGFSAFRARLRVLNMNFEEMIWRNAAGKPLRQGLLSHHGVKEKYQPLYQKLVLNMANPVNYDTGDDAPYRAQQRVQSINAGAKCNGELSAFLHLWSVLHCTIEVCFFKGL